MPVEDGLDLGDVMAFGAEQLGGRICERERGDSLVSVVAKFNAAQIDAVAAAEREAQAAERKRRRWRLW
jgi:hypothetical protein